MDNITDIRNWEHRAAADIERACNTTRLRVAEIPRHKHIGIVEIGLEVDSMGCKTVFVVYDRERRADGKADLKFLCDYTAKAYPEAEWVRNGLENRWPNPGNLERLEKYDSAFRSVVVNDMDIFGDEAACAVMAKDLVARAALNWGDFIGRLKAAALEFEVVDDHKLVYYRGKPVEAALAEIEEKKLEAERNIAACKMLNGEIEAAGIGLKFIEVPCEGLYSVAKVSVPDTPASGYLAYATMHSDFAARINSYLSAVNAPEADSIEVVAEGVDPLLPFDMESEGARRLDALLYELGPKTDIAHAKLKEAVAAAVCKAIDVSCGTEGQHVCDLSGSPLAGDRKLDEMRAHIADLEKQLAERMARVAEIERQAQEAAEASAKAPAGLGPDTVVACVFSESDVARALADAHLHVSPALIDAVSTELRRSAESWAASAVITLSRNAVEVANRKAASILCGDIAAFIDAQAAQMPFARGVYRCKLTGSDEETFGIVGAESDGAPVRISNLAAIVQADRGSWHIESGMPEALVLATDAGTVTVRYLLAGVVDSLTSSAGGAADAASIFKNAAACITPPMKYALVSEFPNLTAHDGAEAAN